jgi:hypothetical protein
MPKSTIFYLALAIGAQARARDEYDELLAEQCFGYGRQLATYTMMDDPSLSTVQAFTLITYYMIAACRRNAAFTNLGVAVRAAYTLGIHLHETNTAFVKEEGILRERAWKSLRVLDLFLSASMGRPPGTSEAVCNIPWASIESNSDGAISNAASQVFSAIFRICHVFERILVEVYSKKAVSLELARSISKQHRQWTEELPRTLKIDRLQESDEAPGFGMSPRHGSGIVTMAYYYSIVLLTRPFLTSRVRLSSKNGPHSIENSSVEADLATYAAACVDSAIKGIDIAHEYVYEQNTPRRQPLVVNSVFISALCLGLAYLEDYDQHRWPLGRSLDRGIAILTHLGPLNPQSARYAEICRLLKTAVLTYVEKRDNSLLESHSNSVRSIFGDLRASAEPRSFTKGRTTVSQATHRSESSPYSDETAVEPISPSSYGSNTLYQNLMTPMSGNFPGHVAEGHHFPYQENSDTAALPQRFFNTNNVTPLDDYPFEHDVPLFSLTHDFASGTYLWH